MKTWIYGDNNNRASVETWGSEEECKRILATLNGCSGCYDCSDCSGCSGCSGCSDCSDCYGCSGCSRCYGCYDCSDCSDCSRCYDCSGENAKGEPLVIPIVADIHNRIYEAASKPGALDMAHFHTCEKTHCRAGWAVALAGKAGYELERRTDYVFAAMQIYKASGYEISPCRFFDKNEAALKDMKELAGV